MKKEIYDSLSEKERVMYDELAGFSARMAERLEEVIDLLKTIVAIDAE